MTDEILAKIRKILAKAEDPAATPEEAETYTAKAAELIASYGIDRALLAESDPSSDVVGDRVVVLDPPYALDKTSLLCTVAVSLRCRAVQRVRYVDGAKQISLHLFGFDSDLARAEMLFTSLLLQATSRLTHTPVPRGEHSAAFRRSWLAGFTGAVGRRLRDAERRAQQQSARQTAPQTADGRVSAVALVLADRSSQVDSVLREEYPYLGRVHRRTLSGTGRGAGWQAGETADLGVERLRRNAVKALK
jgi:Protein of unknown function (DUF2786)